MKTTDLCIEVNPPVVVSLNANEDIYGILDKAGSKEAIAIILRTVDNKDISSSLGNTDTYGENISSDESNENTIFHMLATTVFDNNQDFSKEAFEFGINVILKHLKLKKIGFDTIYLTVPNSTFSRNYLKSSEITAMNLILKRILLTSNINDNITIVFNVGDGKYTNFFSLSAEIDDKSDKKKSKKKKKKGGKKK